MSNTNVAKRTNQLEFYKSGIQLFLKRQPEGDYAIRKPKSEKTRAVLPTQAEAIERALELSLGVVVVQFEIKSYSH